MKLLRFVFVSLPALLLAFVMLWPSVEAQTPRPAARTPCVYTCTQSEGCFYLNDCATPPHWRLARKNELFGQWKCRPLAGDDGWECVNCPNRHSPTGPPHPTPPCPDGVR